MLAHSVTELKVFLLYEHSLLTLGASVFVLNFWVSLVAQLVKESTCNAGYLGSIPGLERSPGEGNGLSTKLGNQQGVEIKENKNFSDWSKTNHHILAPAVLEREKKKKENELANF